MFWPTAFQLIWILGMHTIFQFRSDMSGICWTTCSRNKRACDESYSTSIGSTSHESGPRSQGGSLATPRDTALMRQHGKFENYEFHPASETSFLMIFWPFCKGPQISIFRWLWGPRDSKISFWRCGKPLGSILDRFWFILKLFRNNTKMSIFWRPQLDFGSHLLDP